jgi:hypothetical protein
MAARASCLQGCFQSPMHEVSLCNDNLSLFWMELSIARTREAGWQLKVGVFGLSIAGVRKRASCANADDDLTRNGILSIAGARKGSWLLCLFVVVFTVQSELSIAGTREGPLQEHYDYWTN